MSTHDPALVAKVTKALLDEGAAPGNSIHSWRCEYPDRYGDCDCVEQTAREVLDAVADQIRAQAERERDEAIHRSQVAHGDALRYAEAHNKAGRDLERIARALEADAEKARGEVKAFQQRGDAEAADVAHGCALAYDRSARIVREGGRA